MKSDVKIFFLLILIAVVFGILKFLPEGATAVSRRPLGEFPAVVEEWKMVKAYPMDERTMNILKVDDFIMRDYRDGRNRLVNLYIGYFKYQDQGKAIHSPRQCLPGAGWSPLVMEKAEMAVAGGGKMKVQKMLMGKGSDRQWCIFWYHGRGRIHGSEYLNKLYLILDAVTQRRTDGALVRIIVNAGSDHDESLKILDRFVRLIAPGLDLYIPS